MRRGTGAIYWPLVTGNNDDPTVTQGKPVSFFCNTVPDRCPTGPLAYYLPVFLVTILATLTQPATSGSPIYWDQMPQALINNVQLLNCWHGTPISNNYVVGTNLPVVEFHQNGYVRPALEKPPWPAAGGAYPVEMVFALNPATCLIGNLESETSQLALLFQTGQLKLTMADSTVINGLSVGATLTNITVQVGAVLVPRNELVLGTPVEAVMHQIVAGSGSSQVQIKGFGTDTALTGIEDKGGVLSLMELTSINGQGGAFTLENVTLYNFDQWSGQTQVTNIRGYFDMMTREQLPVSRSQAFPSVVAGGDSNMASFPYAMSKSDAQTTTSTNLDLTSALFFPMRLAGNDISLANVQTADADKSFFMTVNGGFTGSNHVIVGFYARRFNDAMRAAWVKKVSGGNDPLSEYVLGAGNTANASLGQRVPTGSHLLTNDNFTYLPWQLSVPPTPAAAATS
jgi:hypothetical protein